MGTIFQLISLIFFPALFWLSFTKSKNDQFYSDVPKPLLLFGIYVWGDGLVLAPFWAASALGALIIRASSTQMYQYFLVFILVRSAYETVYWIGHQMAGKKYKPPHLRNVSWLDAEAQAILYQLFHTCIIILAITLLWWSLR